MQGNPWGISENKEPVSSFAKIMEEELAKQHYLEEQSSLGVKADDVFENEVCETEDFIDDYTIAELLQKDYDLGVDDTLRLKGKQYKKGDKDIRKSVMQGNPWGISENKEPVSSFAKIMEEELAKQHYLEEQSSLGVKADDVFENEVCETEDFIDDYTIAELLQKDYDLGVDDTLRLKGKQYKKGDKGIRKSVMQRNPWGISERREPVSSFAEIMDEELARKLHLEELSSLDVIADDAVETEVWERDDCIDDYAIAMLLQKDYDLEFEHAFRLEEKQYSKGDKEKYDSEKSVEERDDEELEYVNHKLDYFVLLWRCLDLLFFEGIRTSIMQRNPWGISDRQEPLCSFAEIMDEELARKLHLEDSSSSGVKADDAVENELCERDDCVDDYTIAKLLQKDYDLEVEHTLRLKEKQYNKDDKVGISLELLKPSREKYESDESVEERDDEELEYVNNKLDSYTIPEFGSKGVVFQNGRCVTKHDNEICGRKNVSKFMQFPAEFNTGDAAKMDLKLSNRVFNQLKVHSINMAKRRHRLHENKEKATAELAVDTSTRMILFKMINGNLLESVGGQVATGKESVVFHAVGGSDLIQERQCSDFAVKVFKTTLNEFQNRTDYVQEDYRFKNTRKILKLWAEKEYRNLKRFRTNGIPCPDPVTVQSHVLLMSFIGDEKVSAPKLKDVQLDLATWEVLYDELKSIMKSMFRNCRLVHADLSEFNILYWNEKLWIIDVAQATDLSNPQCFSYLARDCRNVNNFFAERGVRVCSVRELFNEITDLKFNDDCTFNAEVEDLVNSSRPKVYGKRCPADCLLDGQNDHDASVNERDFAS
ncbi:Serine/threonine-protein kinase RIO3 [Trichinella pseudospiralis]|uniref:non-specific serine/threonine protein kinase n=2 Tax=Trichinella pseudospiralis TaxID=6337 RepID=A0A0V1EQC5_TRIPS|nr:Serine/threonine-protein kinase RIO3 [Trichinella pseudospiralis]